MHIYNLLFYFFLATLCEINSQNLLLTPWKQRVS